MRERVGAARDAIGQCGQRDIIGVAACRQQRLRIGGELQPSPLDSCKASPSEPSAS
jgi:hypothetical protein